MKRRNFLKLFGLPFLGFLKKKDFIVKKGKPVYRRPKTAIIGCKRNDWGGLTVTGNECDRIGWDSAGNYYEVRWIDGKMFTRHIKL